MKLAFLVLLCSEFLIWRAEGRIGAFYDYAVRKFFKKYGYTITGAFNINPAEDPPEVDDVDDVDSGCRTAAEADVYAARFKELRLVSNHTHPEIVSKLTFCVRYFPIGFVIVTLPIPHLRQRRRRAANRAENQPLQMLGRLPSCWAAERKHRIGGVRLHTTRRHISPKGFHQSISGGGLLS